MPGRAPRQPSAAVVAAARIAQLEQQLARLQRENLALREVRMATPVALLDLDEEGKVQLANARAAELLRVDPAGTLVGRGLGELFTAEHTQNLLEAMRQLPVGTGEERRCMVRGGQRRGARAAVWLRAVLSRRPDGDSGYTLVLNDVTDIELRRQELAADVELMEALLEVAGVEFYEWQPDLHFRSSRGFARMLGKASGAPFQPTLDSWLERVHPADRARFRERWSGTVSGRLPPIEYRVIGDDGLLRWLRSVSIVRRGEDGSLQNVTGVIRDVSAEHAARELLADRAAMTELIPDFLVQLTPDLRLGYINPVAERFFQESGMAEMPSTLDDIPFTEQNRGKVRALVGQLVERGQRARVSLVAQMHPSRPALDIVAVPVFADDGTVDHALIAARDVSALVQAEQEARKNLLRLQTLVDTARAAILMLDTQGKVTLANAAFCRAAGFDAKEVLGMPMDTFCFAEDHEQRRQAVAAVRATGSASFEWRMRTREGAERWFQVDGSSFRDGDDPLLQFVFIGTDIEAARRERGAMIERERWLDRILRDAGIGAFRFDRSQRSGDVVGAYARLYRLPEPRILHGAELLAMVPDGHRDTFEATLRRFLSGNGRMTLDYPVTLQDGAERWLRAVLRLEGAEAAHRGVLSCVLLDITEDHERALEREELQRQVYQAQKTESLGVMAGGIAHDLNNMLMAALGQLSLALACMPADSPLRPYLDTVDSVLGRMEGLTERMLAYAGKSAVRMEPVDACALLDGMEPLLRASAGRNTRMRIEVVERPLWFRGDSTQLEQVLLNFVQNAVDAIGDRGGQVLVRMAGLHRSEVRPQGLQWSLPKAERYLEITVRDDGPGMDESTVRRIFEPFFTTKSTGRGLGLSVVQGIVKAHQGSIKLLSRRGIGTEFRVYLPLLADARLAAHPLAAGNAVAQARPSARILVVDDDEDVLAVTELMLQESGYQVAAYLSGDEALADFLRAPDAYAAAVIDLTMPVLDGSALAARLRAQRPQLPVLFVSGYSRQQAAELAIEDERTRFLRKPFRQPQLVKALGELLVGA